MIKELVVLAVIAAFAILAGTSVLSARRRRALDLYQHEFTSFDGWDGVPRTLRSSAKRLSASRQHRRLACVALAWIVVGIGAVILDMTAHFPPPGHRIPVQALGALVAVVGAILLAVAHSDPAT